MVEGLVRVLAAESVVELVVGWVEEWGMVWVGEWGRV